MVAGAVSVGKVKQLGATPRSANALVKCCWVSYLLKALLTFSLGWVGLAVCKSQPCI